MPEHVHLLISEPERKTLAIALQMLKQVVSQKLRCKSSPQFWQSRYYDFNVHSERKRVEKLRYLHRNPVTRGLVATPEDWAWSSFRHYLTGEPSVVEVESRWTAQRRERMGIALTVSQNPLLRSPASAKSAEGWGTRNLQLPHRDFVQWSQPCGFPARYTRPVTAPSDLLEALQRYWGYDSFRPLQERIIAELSPATMSAS